MYAHILTFNSYKKFFMYKRVKITCLYIYFIVYHSAGSSRFETAWANNRSILVYRVKWRPWRTFVCDQFSAIPKQFHLVDSHLALASERNMVSDFGLLLVFYMCEHNSSQFLNRNERST